MILQIEALKSFPILPAAISSRYTLNHIEFLLDSVLKVNLAGIKDRKGRNVLTVGINHASMAEPKCWDTYYEPLLELINSKVHNINAMENKLSSRGNALD